MNKESGFKTEFQANPSPLSPIHLNPSPMQLNTAQSLSAQSPFFFEKVVKSPPGHGQSQCDKCGWNFDNESFLQVTKIASFLKNGSNPSLFLFFLSFLYSWQ